MPDDLPITGGKTAGFIGWLRSLKTRHKVIAAFVSLVALLAAVDSTVFDKYFETLLRGYALDAWKHRDSEIAVAEWHFVGAALLLLTAAAWVWFKLDSERDKAKEALEAKDKAMSDLRKAKDDEIANLLHQLRTDDLTKVPNRRQIREIFEKHMKALRSEDRPFSLAYIDIVSFKELNERFLHERADAVLREFASTVVRSLRGGDDTLFRLAGDQFALLLSGATVSEVSGFVAPRINRRLSETPFFVDVHPTTNKNVEVTLQCRFGITDCLVDEVVEVCLKRADAALRQAKKEKLRISAEEKTGIRIVTKAMVLDNLELVAAEPIIKLPD
jgi:diguanylate cyclase (GGDEF)-like protein